MPDTSVPADYAAATQQAAQAAQQLKQQLQAPVFQQQARQLMASRMEYERTVAAMKRVNEQEAIRLRAMDTQRRYGRLLGGAINGFGAVASNGLAQQAWGAAQYGASYVQSMAQRGFQGTTDMARLENETTLLSREFAGVMQPMMDMFTAFTKKARQSMEKMDRDDQDRLMNTVLGVAGLGMALRYRGVIGSALGGGASMLGLTQGGGLGGTLGRFAGRAGVAGVLFDMGKSAVGEGQRQAKESNPYSYTFAEQNPDMAKLLDRLNPEQQRALLEKASRDKPNALLRGLGSVGKWGRNTGAWLLNQIPIGDRIKYIDENSSYDQLKREIDRRGNLGGAVGRRMPTLQGGGVQEAGAGYFSIMQQYGRAAWEKDSGGAESSEQIDLLKVIAKNTEPKPEVR